MRILVINGSPHGAKGNTALVTAPFLEGAREAGADTKVVYLKDLEIKHCIGCFTCWTRTPGVCVHKDDMPPLLEKVRDCDVLVLATPLYVYTVSGLMKDFLDRIIPLAQPYIIKRGEHYIHPSRFPTHGKVGKTVLISNAGFPEHHHFSGLIETVRRWCDTPTDELVGTICCAGGPLIGVEALQDQVGWYRDAAFKAGRELVLQGRISLETQAVLDRPLIADAAAYCDMANSWWQSQAPPLYDPEAGAPDGAAVVSGAKAIDEADGARPLSPPRGMDTMRDLVAGMAMSFNAEAAGKLETVIQFDVTDDGSGQYHLVIGEGRCTAYEGEHESPKLTIHTPADVWMAVSRGEMSGATALMTGKYRVDGNLTLLMRLGSLFARPNA